MTFAAIWQDLLNRLEPGAELSGWGAKRGFTPLRFTVIDKSRGAVTVDSKTLSAPRTISKGEFERIYALWEGYCAHRIDRQDMIPISQNSSYILAIFRWREDTTKDTRGPGPR